MSGVVEEWFGEEVPSLLKTLLPIATRVLQAEDHSLAVAFSRAPPTERLEKQNHGLGYALFETTLVYQIFKAWLPLVEAEWEGAYDNSDSGRQKADLIICRDSVPCYVFEAKWWMTRGMDSWIAADLEKMRRWREVEKRYFLAFWRSHGHEEKLRSEVEEVHEFGRKHSSKLVYLSRFASDDYSTRLRGESSFFFFAVLEV